MLDFLYSQKEILATRLKEEFLQGGSIARINVELDFLDRLIETYIHEMDQHVERMMEQFDI